MTPANLTDPVSVLLRFNDLTRARLQGLRSGQADMAHQPVSATHQAAIDWLEGPAQTQRLVLEDLVYPALVESMAGSDAVCLRNLTGNLTRERDELDRLWRAAILPGLLAKAPDDTGVRVWITDFESHLRQVDEELLPMVPRLFDDEALDALAQACESLLRVPDQPSSSAADSAWKNSR